MGVPFKVLRMCPPEVFTSGEYKERSQHRLNSTHDFSSGSAVGVRGCVLGGVSPSNI